MSIKTVFSIKDLENLSGVKAHTIRIWEKRYNLFQPQRTDTNIRVYGNDELQKILNIALLNNNGWKVSKIAELDESAIQEEIKKLLIAGNTYEEVYNDFKLAMLNFDKKLFDATYAKLIAEVSFKEIFVNVFARLLKEIGILWHSNTIKPVHEHFISTLISQKILLNIEKLKVKEKTNNKTYVLFLPVNEIHQIGLLYVHYELLSQGNESIYLGPNVPIQNLEYLQLLHDKIEFISYFTVEPTKENVEAYLEDMYRNILSKRNEQFYILGRQLENYKPKKKNIILYDDLKSFVESI
ncbi:MAG: MerR family transcriptional regulator [Chitinophagales bacterium]